VLVNLVKNAIKFTREAMNALSRYDWPGNVRELQNEVERSLVLNPDGGAVGLDVLSEKIRPAEGKPRSWRREGKLKEVISEVEREMIQAAFQTCGGNKTRMSEQLGSAADAAAENEGFRNRVTIFGRQADYPTSFSLPDASL
jgi:transcriptional regulator with PAS, ATPase and Fis domain